MSGQKRRKPTGNTGPISFGADGALRKLVEFPRTKEEIELFIGRLFVAGNTGMRPHISRYGALSDLQPQRENSVDLKVQTMLGSRWLELAEFAPLAEYGGSYENVPTESTVERLANQLIKLIQKKNNKNYGSDVILLIYKTHETLFIPPPIQRLVRLQLRDSPPPFESIYFLSPHDQQNASVWEIWPGDPKDSGPLVTGGSVQLGLGNSQP